MSLRLYQYWRSSASWRVRWALAHKGIAFESIPVNLLEQGQRSDSHTARNPMQHVPALEVSPGRFLAESVAILEWLEQMHPDPALYPSDPWLRARVRQVCELVNAGIQPLQNLTVLAAVSSDAEVKKAWAARFNARGLTALESLLCTLDAELGEGTFAVGNSLTAADLFVVPQVYSARRFAVDLTPFPRVLLAERSALATPHAHGALPESQADAT
ncbi:MAG: maleylacetoacetate isomerase [Deltaproteobacteria bacterium]|nr:maleylacetoacetate isomerase [Deltaproteobacteria bacterium]